MSETRLMHIQEAQQVPVKCRQFKNAMKCWRGPQCTEPCKCRLATPLSSNIVL